MTTSDHISAIKEHLKAIEAEKQPKKESKRYLVMEIDYSVFGGYTLIQSIALTLAAVWRSMTKEDKMKSPTTLLRMVLEDFISRGKIITINEE